MKYNHANRISLPCYEYAFRTLPLYECSVKVSTTHYAVEISRKPPPPLTHKRRDYTELLSIRTFKHSEFLIKNEYLVLNFLSDLGAYEHNLLAYERDIGGANLQPGVNLLPGAILHPGANCAHEHGYRWKARDNTSSTPLRKPVL